MNCFMCKGHLEEVFTAYMVEKDDYIIVIKNVPTRVCCECGEKSYTLKVVKRIEAIIETVKNSIAEDTIVNYSDKVA